MTDVASSIAYLTGNCIIARRMLDLGDVVHCSLDSKYNQKEYEITVHASAVPVIIIPATWLMGLSERDKAAEFQHIWRKGA